MTDAELREYGRKYLALREYKRKWLAEQRKSKSPNVCRENCCRKKAVPGRRRCAWHLTAHYERQRKRRAKA